MVDMAKICVIGGICADVSGTPFAPLAERDSNPSRVSVSAGGVGFNIARRLAALGHTVDMICAIGSDALSPCLISAAKACGVSLEYAVFNCASSGVYICVNDIDGDMRIAMSDLGETESAVTPSVIERHISHINCCDACVADGNLSAETLLYISQAVSVPIFADPVSTKKAMRFLPVLGSLAAIKPNIYEARAMTGKDDPQSAARELVRRGCGAAFVSCGAEGVYYADQTVSGFSPAVRVNVKNTTGAGDAAAAMLLHTMLSCTNKTDSALAAACANRYAASVISGE